MPKIVDAFNRSQSEPEAELQIVPVNEVAQKYAVAAAGGTAPVPGAAGLELRGVTKSFDAVDVLKGIDRSVSGGEFVVFVGPFGCGKPTLSASSRAWKR